MVQPMLHTNIICPERGLACHHSVTGNSDSHGIALAGRENIFKEHNIGECSGAIRSGDLYPLDYSLFEEVRAHLT
jgi:hypothetical protein